MARFGYTILYVKDVEAMLSFYERAFGFKQRFISPDGSYGELITGETTLSFARHDLAMQSIKSGFIHSDPGSKPFAMEIGIVAEDIESVLVSAVNAGAVKVLDPITKPWGQTVAYVRDPEGFLVEVCTPMG